MNIIDSDPVVERRWNIECPECSEAVELSLPMHSKITSITAAKDEQEHNVDENKYDRLRHNVRECPCSRNYILSICYDW
jgi:hypothetical protein